jgi:hypothetical protein
LVNSIGDSEFSGFGRSEQHSEACIGSLIKDERCDLDEGLH